jgi:hypothetical protein
MLTRNNAEANIKGIGGTLKYTYSCPLCKESVEVESTTEEEALDMIITEGKAHAKTAHPGFPIPEPMLRNMIKGGMKKVE